jgi:hypothetical protein
MSRRSRRRSRLETPLRLATSPETETLGEYRTSFAQAALQATLAAAAQSFKVSLLDYLR